MQTKGQGLYKEIRVRKNISDRNVRTIVEHDGKRSIGKKIRETRVKIVEVTQRTFRVIYRKVNL